MDYPQFEALEDSLKGLWQLHVAHSADGYVASLVGADGKEGEKRTSEHLFDALIDLSNAVKGQNAGN